MKLKDQVDDVPDQTQAQEQIMMITGMTNKQNDEDISEVFYVFSYVSTFSYSLSLLPMPI